MLADLVHILAIHYIMDAYDVQAYAVFSSPLRLTKMCSRTTSCWNIFINKDVCGSRISIMRDGNYHCFAITFQS